ncbi:MlaD domain-containing protein [Heracleum sosnowskyi]|uniref:MlaD domain-containing protein n=1 Tax=Heracleum sosnowskyi TaxID=360622 RepID=A0AAD8HYM7_9APIA|nr:MlaD domain-containing protein [Heracleum sosnowskyi]
MMASSEVEISSRPPFQNVLGDRSSRGDLWEPDRLRHKKVSKGTDKWARAREIVFETNTSADQSGNSRENRKNGAVSSLVKKWRDFEAESKNSYSLSPCSSRSNASSVVSDISTITDVMHVSNSDVSSEYERNRVAEIIKRLTSVNGEEYNDRDQNVCKYSLPKIRTTNDQSPHIMSAGKIGSPRIRGRHALNEMLMQMERDRYREIQRVRDYKAVSNFVHRKRLQRLLRVRFLRQGLYAKDGSKPPKSTESETKEHPQGSSILHLRDKFNTECIVAESSPRKEHRVRKSSAFSPTKEVTDHSTRNTKTLNISTQQKGKTHPQEIAQSGCRPPTNAVANIQEVDTCNDNFTPSHHTSELQKSDKEVGPGLGETCKKKSYDIKTFDLLQLSDKSAAASLIRFKGHDAEQSNASLHEWIKESGHEWTSGFTQNQSQWEDREALNFEQEETYQDWVNDVARPRSDWEDLRQERYQEMLDPFLKNGDIKHLLERRSVSTFLTSDMRDKIDQIMMSRTQAKPNLIVNRAEHKLEDVKKGSEHTIASNKIEEEENKSPVGPCEAAECFEQTPPSICSLSPSVRYRSWARNAIHSPTDESVSSPSIEQSPTSNSYIRDDKPSLEMELIYDMKGHVEQIHQELSDLRKALSICISMQQAKPQNLMQTELSDPIHSVATEKSTESISKTSRKGSCCLCSESEVDSLLYRCGHMCTCFKCAEELQWNSGKCPICKASIQDVVQIRPG